MKVPVDAVNKLVEKMVSERLAKKENLTEGVVTDDLLPGGEGKLSSYLSKVEKFIDKVIEEASDLADEGEELLKVNYTSNLSVGERNRMILTSVGFLRKLRNNLALSTIDLRKMLGWSSTWTLLY